jgi:hypothetical protein
MEMEGKMSSNPEELYNMACTLIETGMALKEAAKSMGYEEPESEEEESEYEDEGEGEGEEESDLNGMKREMDMKRKMERKMDYKKGKSVYVNPPSEGEMTDGEMEEEDSPISPMKKNLIVVKLKKRFGKK